MTTTVDANKVTGVSFKDYIRAEHFYNELMEKGYDNDDITIIMSENTKDLLPDHLSIVDEGSRTEAAGKSAMVGGTAGGILGAILALGSNAIIPGLGIVVAGPLLGALLGAGVGGLTGSIIGALTKAGVDDTHAEILNSKIEDGEVVFIVEPKTLEDRHHFQELSTRHNATYYAAHNSDGDIEMKTHAEGSATNERETLAGAKVVETTTVVQETEIK